jgi:predicted metal-dependent phosphoesterase TrpH
MVQLASWLFWLFILAIGIGISKKDKLKNILFRVLRFELGFMSLVMFCLFLPFPAPHLNAPKSFEITDFHSHTFYSHDGLVSPKTNLFYHDNLGFTSFYDTEHGHTAGFDKFPADKRLTTVYPGMQVSTTERVSLLVLADKPYDGELYRNKSVKEVIDLAHSNGFIVVCPHWWKWRYFTWQQLYDFGLDGFEIYNAGYRKFSPEERRRMIDFCKQKNLLMTGSTDWHGWGYLSNVWTAVERPAGSQVLDFQSLRKHITTKVLVLQRPGEIQGLFRDVFEPFVGCYYYFGSIGKRQAFYWIIWLLLLSVVSRLGLLKLLPLALSAIFAGFCAWSIIIWIPLLPENQVLGKLIAPICLAISAGWLLVFKLKNK